MNADEAFAREMQVAMTRLGLSQNACGDALSAAGLPNFHQMTVSRVLSASRKVRLSEAVIIAQVLGMDLTQFFDTAPKPERTARDQVIEQHLRDALALLSPEQGAQS